MKINLDKKEYAFLKNCNFLQKKIIDALHKVSKSDDNFYQIDISDELFALMYKALEDQLQYLGFDENYELTKEGVIIEGLIDKLSNL